MEQELHRPGCLPARAPERLRSVPGVGDDGAEPIGLQGRAPSRRGPAGVISLDRGKPRKVAVAHAHDHTLSSTEPTDRLPSQLSPIKGEGIRRRICGRSIMRPRRARSPTALLQRRSPMVRRGRAAEVRHRLAIRSTLSTAASTGCLGLAEVAQHHRARENRRHRVRDALARNVRRAAGTGNGNARSGSRIHRTGSSAGRSVWTKTSPIIACGFRNQGHEW